jgi:hypothetical protein
MQAPHFVPSQGRPSNEASLLFGPNTIAEPKKSLSSFTSVQNLLLLDASHPERNTSVKS